MFQKPATGYLLAILGVAAVTAALEPIHLRISVTTVSLTLLMVVLFIATFWGSRPAFVASIFGALSLNYFFLPPFGTLSIKDPENWKEKRDESNRHKKSFKACADSIFFNGNNIVDSENAIFNQRKSLHLLSVN